MLILENGNEGEAGHKESLRWYAETARWHAEELPSRLSGGCGVCV